MQKMLFPVLLLFSFGGFCQTKIEGIGKFKIKKTTIASLDSIAKEQDFDKERASSSEEYFRMRSKKNKLVELFPDTVKTYNSPSYSHYCKNARVFYIPKMKISEIELIDTYLTFYLDTLISIHTDYSTEIVEAFTLKYGKPELDKKETEVKCTLKLTGSSITYTEKMYYQEWENNDIKCSAAIGDYRDSKCEKQILSYIIIDIDKIEEKLRNCDEKERNRIDAKQKAEKKKQLDDF